MIATVEDPLTLLIYLLVAVLVVVLIVAVIRRL